MPRGAGQRTQLDPLRQIRLVTLIYQGLDLTGRKMARDASLDLLKSDLPQNVYMAVMVIDHQLEAIQKFTNDRELLKAGVLRATGGDNTNFVGDTERVQAELQQILGPNPGGQSLQQQVNTAQDAANGAASGASTNPGSVMTAQVNALTAQMMLQMLQGQQGMAMVDWGRSSIYALLSAVKNSTGCRAGRRSSTSPPASASRRAWSRPSRTSSASPTGRMSASIRLTRAG